jgi:hypothetical protein
MILRDFIQPLRHADRCTTPVVAASETVVQSSPSDGSGEAGAVLILAMVFLLVASGIVVSLLDWSSNDILNTSNLQSSRSLVYSAGGAADVAIQSARYSSPDSLTTGLSANQLTSSLSVTPLTAPISAGDQVTIGSGATIQTVTATGDAAINATTVNVTSFSSKYAEPVNTLIYDDACFGASPSVTIGGNAMAVWCSLVWTPLSAATRVETFSSCPATTSAASCTTNPFLQVVVTFDDYPSPIGLASTSACTASCGTGMTVDSWVAK